MKNEGFLTSLCIFLTGLIVLVALRRHDGGNVVEVQNSEVVIALVPVALWAFVTGRLPKISALGVSLLASRGA